MNKTVTLRSERLTYEPLNMKHLSEKYVNWMNDKDVNIYMSSGGDYTLEKLRLFLLDQQKKKILFWAIIKTNTKEHIGNIKIDPIDEKRKSGEYGIMIGNKLEWGKGYAKEASKTIIKYCFEEIGLNEITLGVNKSNINAIKLYDRLGFIKFNRKISPDKYYNIKDEIIRMSKNKNIDKIILGTAQFGMDYGINNLNGKINQEEIYKILEYSYDNGIRNIDTAEIYGNSIETIGEFHKQFPQKKFKVFSKVNYGNNNTCFSSNIITNLKKLGVDNYEGYMIHNYQLFKSDQRLVTAMLDAKKSGIILKNGISLYSNFEVYDIIDENTFDFIQLPFNLLDNSKKRESVIKSAKSKDIETYVRSIFLQGLFFKSQSSIPYNLKPLKKYIKKLIKIGLDINIDINELALKYSLSKSYIDKIIFGIDNLSQLEKNIDIIKNEVQIPSVKIDKINVLENELLNPTNW
tara:strand:+ start:1108 stop:2493 length:1386 start_codon:yes stop_codon:yes gene_type:complete